MDYSDVTRQVADTLSKGGEPLNDTQFVMLAGCLSVWLEKAREQGGPSSAPPAGYASSAPLPICPFDGGKIETNSLYIWNPREFEHRLVMLSKVGDGLVEEDGVEWLFDDDLAGTLYGPVRFSKA